MADGHNINGAPVGQEDREWYRERWKQRQAAEEAAAKKTIWKRFRNAAEGATGEGPKMNALHLLVWLALLAGAFMWLTFN